jgi:formylglycine-generating enzyme required for sulfatase activity
MPVASTPMSAAPVADEFADTVENSESSPDPAPEGMVWIPGGEFSMGTDAGNESLCGMPGLTRDALPVHRGYVDGFWRDTTEVTNEQFEKFVKVVTT